MTQFKSEFLNIMLERGFYNQCTNIEGFDDYLYACEKSGKPAVGYLGPDPTGDSLHVGHIVPLMMLRWFQKCGHKPLTLVGGATAQIGDPSGKDKLRPFLDEQTLAHNIEGLKKSFSKFLRFGNGATDALMVDNWDWFKDINYLAFLRDIGTCYSVNRMLTMDSVKSRLEREQPMSFLEFNYMLLQGYDFCVLLQKYNCRAQIAGADQWEILPPAQNWVVGAIIPNCSVLPARLLPIPAAKKWANRKATRCGLMMKNCRLMTIINIFAISAMRKWVNVCVFILIYRWMKCAVWNNSKTKKLMKLKILAFEATKICRGLENAEAAQATAVKTFEQGAAGDDLPTLNADLESGIGALDAFRKLVLLPAKAKHGA